MKKCKAGIFGKAAVAALVVAALIAAVMAFSGCEQPTDDDKTPPKVAMPEVNVEAGPVASGTQVTLTCETEGAAIYYTIDGSEPDKTNNDQLYDSKTTTITINAPTTVKAIAAKDGMTDSDMLTAEYTIAATPPEKVATPTASPASGQVTAETQVTLSTTTSDATIYYTVDGSEPDKTNNDQLYDSETTTITISAATTIKAIAVKDGMTDSDILTAAYTITVSPSGLAAYLATLPAGTATEPNVVVFESFNVSGNDWGTTVKNALAASNKYVTLDLSTCTATNNTISGGMYPSGNHFNVINGNTYIKGIVLPSTLTTIGESALDSCPSLVSVTIPSGVTSIAFSAFYGCTSLVSVTIPSGVTNMGTNVFDGCSSLVFVTIPSSLTSISGYSFQYCTSLASITIPEGVTSIGEYAFYGCSSLASITIPSGVTTTLNATIFGACTSLVSVTIQAVSPPTIGSGPSLPFSNMAETFKIYVPEDSVDAYKTATNWTNYADKITAIPAN